MSIVRYVRIPKPVAIVDLSTGQPIMLASSPTAAPAAWVMTFRDFLCAPILKDPRFGKNLETVLSAAAILKAVKDAETSDQIAEISDADHALLKSVVDAPEGGYAATIALQIISFARAILDAPTTDPRSAA